MITPKFTLDFTAASLDGRVTFTRTTGASNPATYFSSSGYITSATNNQPRFDYDPVTLACKGLLIEESRQNRFIYSNDISNAAWTKSASLGYTASSGTSPTGSNDAIKITPPASTATAFVYQNTTLVFGTIYTHTVYAKAGEFGVLQIASSTGFDGSGAYYRNFDLVNGVLGGGTSTALVPASITPVGNGWYRCSYTNTAFSSVSGRCVIYIVPSAESARAASVTGNASDSLFVFGFQMEAGAFATSYIPTTTTALTRNADVATITGTNFSDFWQATKGGASVLAMPSTVSGIRPLVQFDDNTANEIIALRGNTTNPELYIVDGGVDQAQIDAGTIAANTAYSLTGWWQTNDCKARKDSGAVVTDTTATIPTVTQARIGSDGTNYLNGTIATINYYDSFFGQPIYTRRKNKVFSSLL